MDKDLDVLLGSDLLEPPDDFTARVMQGIEQLPRPVRRKKILERLQQWALIAGGIASAAQLAAFMFGIWTVSTVM